MRKNPKYKVTIENQALEMFYEHIEFLAQVSYGVAYKLELSLKKARKNLTINPFMYPFADELDVPGIPLKIYRKCLFNERYKVIFLVEDNNVRIYAIIDTRMENKNLF